MHKLKAVLLALAMTATWACGDAESPLRPSAPTTVEQQAPATPTPSATQETTPPAEPAPPTPPADDPPPTPPVEDPAPAPTPPPTPPPAPPAPPSDPVPPPGGSCYGLGDYSTPDNGRTVTVRNKAPYTCSWVFAIWKMPVPYPQAGWDDQKMIDWKDITLSPGATGTVTLMAPPCGINTQADSYPGITSKDVDEAGWKLHPKNPNRYPNDKHWFGLTPTCPPPPPPPGPTCESVNLSVLNTTASRNDTHVIVSPKFTWVGAGSVSVEWGDGQSTVSPSSGTQLSHSYARGSTDKVYTVTARYSGVNPACTKSFQVEVPKLPPPPPPPPPPCSQTNPPSFWADGRVVQTSDRKDGVTVTVSYKYGNLQNEKIAIYWVGKENQWVKKLASLHRTCEEGKVERELVWQSYDYAHLLSNHARYWIIRYKGADPTSLSDPDIIWKKDITPTY